MKERWKHKCLPSCWERELRGEGCSALISCRAWSAVEHGQRERAQALWVGEHVDLDDLPA